MKYEAYHETEHRGLNRPEAARYLGRAVRTLLVTPMHARIYRVIKEEDVRAGVVVPLQPDLPDIVDEVSSRILPLVAEFGRPMPGPDVAVSAALLMQFANHFPEVPDHLMVPYSTVAELGAACISRAQQEGRLSLADQLSIALDHADGHLDEGLRNIFITSRMHARWLDRRMLPGTPELTSGERLQKMRAWQDSLLAFKPGGDEYHDTAGDTYYAWTHAYAGYMFDRLQRHQTVATSLARTAFRRGTYIMQTCVNNLNPRGTISDHTVAARYGNAVAEALSEWCS